MTTYVLGAGASFHAGYPLASELGNALVGWLLEDPTPVKEMYGGCIQELHRLYGGLQNLEQILEELETCPPQSRVALMDAAVRRNTIRNMRLMIPEFFRSRRHQQASLYKRLAREIIRPDDVVITFNYDVALERELKAAGLWEVSDGYGFSINADAAAGSRVALLKLHGSANWLSVVFNGNKGLFQGPPTVFGSRPVILPGEFEFLGYSSDVRDSLAPRGTAGALPAIIMPTFNKRFYEQTASGPELEGFWDYLWDKAESALWNSERIVIVGYSLPEADTRANELLLGGANRNADIEIFSGRSSTRISTMFSSRGFCRLSVTEPRHFEDYLRDSPSRKAGVR